MALESHSELFNSMLELIPARYYQMKDEDFVQSTKYFQNKKSKTSKELHKEKRLNAKRKRLNPNPSDSFEGEEKDAETLSDTNDGDVMHQEPSLAVNIASKKSLSLEELRRRLREKIEGLRKVRNVDKEHSSGKRTWKEESKAGKAKKPRVVQSVGLKSTTDNSATDDKGEELKFNRLHFESKESTSKRRNKRKNLKISLAKAEAHQKKIEDISKGDSEKGKSVVENDKWKKAINKAIGIKQKDDPVLLQRTLKKLEKKKKRSQKEWKSRKDTQEKFKESKQAKREKNVRERIEEKKQRNAGKRRTNKRTGKKKKT